MEKYSIFKTLQKAAMGFLIPAATTYGATLLSDLEQQAILYAPSVINMLFAGIKNWLSNRNKK